MDLAPARNLQPKARTIRYDNMRSAMAEEAVIAMVLKEPALLDRAGKLQGNEFSSPLLGKVFAQLQQRHREGLTVSVAVLAELSGEEMSHIAGITQRQDGPVNEAALDINGDGAYNNKDLTRLKKYLADPESVEIF